MSNTPEIGTARLPSELALVELNQRIAVYNRRKVPGRLLALAQSRLAYARKLAIDHPRKLAIDQQHGITWRRSLQTAYKEFRQVIVETADGLVGKALAAADVTTVKAAVGMAQCAQSMADVLLSQSTETLEAGAFLEDAVKDWQRAAELRARLASRSDCVVDGKLLDRREGLAEATKYAKAARNAAEQMRKLHLAAKGDGAVATRDSARVDATRHVHELHEAYESHGILHGHPHTVADEFNAVQSVVQLAKGHRAAGRQWLRAGHVDLALGQFESSRVLLERAEDAINMVKAQAVESAHFERADECDDRMLSDRAWSRIGAASAHEQEANVLAVSAKTSEATAEAFKLASDEAIKASDQWLSLAENLVKPSDATLEPLQVAAFKAARFALWAAKQACAHNEKAHQTLTNALRHYQKPQHHLGKVLVETREAQQPGADGYFPLPAEPEVRRDRRTPA